VSKPLVVVESPTKVRTIKKYLGNDYNVAATVGHIKDLPSKDLGIDIENDFAPQYKTIPGKTKVLSQLKSAAGDATDIYLAPDPDREGEAIAWHTSEVLKKKGRIFHRVLFHELTKKAILEAMTKARDMDRDKYEAQQTRRILDRLVGYQISPLLWRKVKGGLSAGRVQSVAVRIICDRERAIQAFTPVEYWSITANLKGMVPPAFAAKLVRKNGEKIEIPDEAAATAILKDLESAQFVVDKVIKRTTRRNPLPPFITSKLQQESIQKLRFSAKKTMMVAQQLYEGIDLGPGEPVGLITYMRTDSTRIADEAAQEALALINQRFGKAYAIDRPRFFKNKNKAQDAHEAIRPTSVHHTPDQVKRYLSKDQLALYTMIWQRFVASQMAQALIDQKTLSIAAGDYTFTASGSSVKFPGFLAVYRSADDEAESNKKSQPLPELAEKSLLELLGIDPKQHFTQPPPRFSEASLVKELEENGIGRPSTYAAILSTIRGKGYVELINRYFKPTELGFIVNDLLIASFPEILDVEFTARLETDLDRVEQSEVEALTILNQFYGPFSRKLAEAGESMLSVKGVGMPTDLTCPLCQKNPCASRWVKTVIFWPVPVILNAPTPAITSGMKKESSPRWHRFNKVKRPTKYASCAANPWLSNGADMGIFSHAPATRNANIPSPLMVDPMPSPPVSPAPKRDVTARLWKNPPNGVKFFTGATSIRNAVLPAGISRWQSPAPRVAMPTWSKKQPNGTAPCTSAPTATAVTARRRTSPIRS